MDKKTVNILGTEYSIHILDYSEHKGFEEADGWCDVSTKDIYIGLPDEESLKDPLAIADLDVFINKVLNHEIVHAYLYESGLDGATNFAKDEILIDFIAIQGEKIVNTFNETKIKNIDRYIKEKTTRTV